MGFLNILEDRHLGQLEVPGTAFLDNSNGKELGSSKDENLKYGTGKHSNTVLVPQPSDDPNDPLNFSPAKKLSMTTIVAFGVVIFSAVIAPMLAPGLVVIAEDFKRPLTDVALLTGYQSLVVGISLPLVSACSVKWGKRPVMLVSALFGFVGSVMGSVWTSFDGLVWSRIVQGGSVAAFESVGISMIGDLYFVHERGFYMALMQFLLGATSNFTAVIAGPITAELGWEYLFYLLIPFTGIETLLLYLFVPETQYIRKNRDAGEVTMVGKDGGIIETIETGSSIMPTRKTFTQQLAVFTGTYSNENFFQLLVTPFAICINLPVLWSVIVSGGAVALVVVQSIILPQVFAAPPYLLSPSGVGYLSLGPFVGGLLSAVVMAAIGDPLVRWACKKNGGIYEPEYRLLSMIGGFLMPLGALLFGYLAQNGVSYWATASAHGIDVIGVIVVATSTAAYGVDAYREMASEVFVLSAAFKAFVFYSFSYFVNNWTETAGVGQVFYVLSLITTAIILTTPIIFIYGKRYRSYWKRANILGRLHLQTHAE
ncbi:putative mfs transporter protein [Neofusicoccum parvum]|uniref:Mfs transporter protein n=1 Tax=Neofusicoccum parvum TaxID=310453 RepID=A0ACB5RXP3_9PEZI|nr:putative mfs transporter protein [Neofusicoccum parvum]